MDEERVELLECWHLVWRRRGLRFPCPGDRRAAAATGFQDVLGGAAHGPLLGQQLNFEILGFPDVVGKELTFFVPLVVGEVRNWMRPLHPNTLAILGPPGGATFPPEITRQFLGMQMPQLEFRVWV